MWASTSSFIFSQQLPIALTLCLPSIVSLEGTTIYPVAAKRSIPCAPLLSLNGSTIITAAAELLAYNKKERSYEIIENPTPYVWQIYYGHDTVVSGFQMRYLFEYQRVQI